MVLKWQSAHWSHGEDSLSIVNIEVSMDALLFELVELSSGYSLEISGSLVVTQGERTWT